MVKSDTLAKSFAKISTFLSICKLKNPKNLRKRLQNVLIFSNLKDKRF